MSRKDVDPFDPLFSQVRPISDGLSVVPVLVPGCRYHCLKHWTPEMDVSHGLIQPAAIYGVVAH